MALPEIQDEPHRPERLGKRRGPARKGVLMRLGPGLITGAADDDPSGIATYSQAGAQFGLSMLWTVLATLPLMVAIQLISARIGRVTGKGLGANLRTVFPGPLVTVLVSALFIANVVNIGADIAAMGAAAELITGHDAVIFTLGFAVVSMLLQLFIPYHRYVSVLRWLTLSLFAYVGVVFTVQIDWGHVALRTIAPHITWEASTLTLIVAVFGTTISPYMFFWQSAEEVEEIEVSHEKDLLHEKAVRAREELRRIHFDTVTGMTFSNVIAYFIILATAVTLHQAGVTDITTSAQAAEALKPIAGPFAFLLFALGIIGAGLLAVPVLAGSAAYAVAETRGWKSGLEHWPWEAPRFYSVIVAAMLIALAVVFSPLDPMKALFWSAVINGVVSVPVMAAMMVVATRRHEMGRYVATLPQRIFGWSATVIMAVAVTAMLVMELG